jgi:motility quorum-sensing regulator/GCU-specific mRNA interferase toxin
MTGKRKPTYDLEAFKAAFSTPQKLALTGTALKSAAALGFGRAEIVSTIQTIKREHFYKSMTAMKIAAFGKTCTMFLPLLVCYT